MAHSTNYVNTLILPAADCTARARRPDKPGSVAALQYAYLAGHPYEQTSDDVLAAVAAERNSIAPSELPNFCRTFFDKGQPCFRASPLTKTHGWAVHADALGRLALIDPDGAACSALIEDDAVTKIYAMRNRRG